MTPLPAAPKGFALRRFAGALAHCETLSGLRIAHLTDQHVGRVTPMKAQFAAVALTNACQPDLVVLTGDFVCHGQGYLDALQAVIAGFEAPTLCVLGNHDHWSGAAEVRHKLRAAGAEILDNAHTTLTLRGQQLQVVGLDDAYTGHADRLQATRGLDPRKATLGLSHIAEEADGLWAQGVPLVLSGHTHAGQITVARLHEVSIGRLAGHRYVHGLYGHRHGRPEGTGAVYVGAGIGAAIMPWRLGPRARREVTLFELGTAPGTLDEPLRTETALKGRVPSARTRGKRAAAVERKQAKRRRRMSHAHVSPNSQTPNAR